MLHYVYKTTIVETGEYYIGKHSTDDVNDGYIGSGKSLLEKVTETTPIKFEILEYAESDDAAYEAEERIIGDLWENDDLCLNRCPGGKRGYTTNQKGKAKSKEWREKIAQSNRKPKTGKAREASVRNGLIAAERRKGKKDSEETKRKRAESLSKTLTGVPRPYRRKIIVADGVEYSGFEEVMKAYNLSGRNSVYTRLKNPKWNWHIKKNTPENE